MSSRSKARKQALDILYEADIRIADPLEILSKRFHVPAADASVRDFACALVEGVSMHRRKIDELISSYAQGWDMDRLPAVDRNILRMAIYEILWERDVDDAVAIDEALNLAKSLSTDDSAPFIHGLLARISSLKSELSL